MFKTKLLCINALIYFWIVIGVVETLYLMGIISKNTYVLFSCVNDIVFKGLFFAFIAYKDYFLLLSKYELTYEDIKVLIKFSEYHSNSRNILIRELKRVVKNIISDMNVIKQSAIEMSDRVYCKHFSRDFITRILQYHSVEVDKVYILFSDIHGYSIMCKNNCSKEVVHQLNLLYCEYDKCLESFNSLQKIESIGDCYFITSLLDRNNGKKYDEKNTLKQIIQFAKNILEIANKYETHIRIGIHLGNVSVGIIGIDIPRFAVVGNDVNLAARLESTCEINAIQVSQTVRSMIDLIDIDIPIRSRDIIEAKNIGKVIAYTLE